MSIVSQNTFHTKKSLDIHTKTFHYFSLVELEKHFPHVKKLPFSLKILLENVLRHEDSATVTREDIQAIAQWDPQKTSNHEIAFRPARALMQDFTGVPAVADLAAMRDAMKALGGDPKKINPLSRVDLVIDHSVQVDAFDSPTALDQNTRIEIERNHERYQFLRWAQKAFDNFHVVPPGTGICHQVNLEYLGKAVWSGSIAGELYAYPDTLVGTDSHTTMINGLGVLGWGVGGIEAEAAVLAQPISMLIPEVIGVRLTGSLKEGITATDLVLTITQMLRKRGVVGKFVEFFGEGLDHLALADRATIANMAPEYGATCGFFPIDQETLRYLELTGREQETIQLVEAYAKAQGLWRSSETPDPVFTDVLHCDLGSIEPSLAGPKRPQDKVTLDSLPAAFEDFVKSLQKTLQTTTQDEPQQSYRLKDEGYTLSHGDIVIAAITSCTNTSNPHVLMAAGLLAKKAVEKGLDRKPWVKSSLAPGSKVVTDYLKQAGLMPYLEKLGFYLVGYGCTTCIGNSGPLPDAITKSIQDNDLIVSAVLSGNRNFEGRIHPLVKANWLASPPLVVAYALLGNTRVNIASTPLGLDTQGHPVYLKDIWPTQAEITHEVAKINHTLFQKEYAEVFLGDKNWQSIEVSPSESYHWDSQSTYVQHPPFFMNLSKTAQPIENIQKASILAVFGDSITTDHISPAGSIKADSPAGLYLKSKGVEVKDFNSYGARRGNHEVMMRGTFANIRIRNEMIPGVEGGYTRYLPTGETLSIYDAAMAYQKIGTPLVIIAGKEYGTGSSRDWAAKGPRLLGVKAVIAESFERIHRSNLIGMGILPLQFADNVNRKTLMLDGTETISIPLDNTLKPGQWINVTIKRSSGNEETIQALCRIDTQNELEYYQNGGILQYVLRNMSQR